RIVLGNLHVSNNILRDSNECFLNFGETILPGIATRIVAIEIADRFQIAGLWSFGGSQDISFPGDAIAQFVIRALDGADLETDAGAYALTAAGAGNFVVQSVGTQATQCFFFFFFLFGLMISRSTGC